MNSPILEPGNPDVAPRRSRCSVWRCGLGAAVLVAGTLFAAPFQDDFNDGNDAGWSRFDLTAFLNSQGVPGTYADYSFPDDGQGGKAYRIQAFVHPVPDDGLAPRAFVYRPESYTRFRVAADLLDWNLNSGTAIGLVARITSIGLGQTSGYLFNLNPRDQDVDITLVTGEAPNELADANAFLVPSRGPYRFEFKGTDDALVGHFYNVSDPRAPIGSSAVIDGSYASGAAGLLVFDNNGPANWTGVDVTFDNYEAEELPAGVPPEIVLLEPTHLSVARSIPAPLRSSIFLFDAAVGIVESSITFSVNGVMVPNSALTITAGVTLNDGASGLDPTAGLTVEYTPSSIPTRLSGIHTNAISFRDSEGRTITQEWTHTYAVLPTEYALPPGSGVDPGFTVRLVQSDQETENSLWRAERQLAVPPQLPIDLETNTTVNVINYTQNAVPNDAPDGRFADHATFPGIDPAGNTDDMAMEVLFYLEMPAGTHRFGVTSDDGFQLRVGNTPSDPQGLVLAENTEGTFDGTVDVVVVEAGVYPFRLVWFERGGGAHVEFYAEEAGGGFVLINDAGSRFKAYRSVSVSTVVLESSAGIEGGFAEASGAVIDSGARRITVPLNEGAARFYRLRGAEALKLSSIDLESDTVVLTYE